MNFGRSTPANLAYYEVLLRRAICDERSMRELQTKYYSLRSGYAGERRVDNEWREVNVSGIVLHDFTCRNEFGNSHQMDTLFICKHFVLVVEVKNISGRIDFDDQRRQFLRTREDGKVESFMNPVDQVKRHRELLMNESLNWPEYVPIEAAVVIANPSTVIGRLSSEVPVFNVSGLRTKVQELVQKHANITVNPRTVKSYLEAMYEPLVVGRPNLNYLIRKGVLCLKCAEAMQHGLKGFMCMKCGLYDRDGAALRQAMYDYRILYGGEISNRAFREFVGVTNTWTANKMLKRLFKERKGKNKGSVYIIPEKINGK